MARITTPEATLSYLNIFEPRAMSEKDEPKYSVTLIFPQGTDLSEMKSAIARVLEDKWGSKTKGMLQAGALKTPFRSDPDDVAGKGYPLGSTFVNARTLNAPGVVTIYADPNNDGKPLPLTDRSKAYAGVVARVTLDAYAYDTAGNRGATFGLGNIQILRDGDRLDGRAPAEDEFDADKDAVVTLADLEGVDEDPQSGESEGRSVSGVVEGDDLADLIN